MTDVTHYHAVESTHTTTEPHAAIGPQANRAKFDIGYLKTRDGLLKVVEILLGLIVFICATVAIRERPVFYGCAVWAAIVGFFSMLFTLIWLILHCLHVPSSAASVPWKTIGTAYSALWAIFFLIAGVTLTVVAESAITRQRVTYYVSSVFGDGHVVMPEKNTALPALPEGQSYKREWMIQKTEGNYDEFRPATAGAVFAIAACLVYAADTFITNSKRARDSAALSRKRNKNGVAV